MKVLELFAGTRSIVSSKKLLTSEKNNTIIKSTGHKC